MYMMYNEDLSQRISKLGSDIIKDVTAKFDKEVSSLVDDYSEQYNQSFENLKFNVSIDEHVSELISDHIDDIKHDTKIKHYGFDGKQIDPNDPKYDNIIDPECVGKCKKCSLLHFVNVRYMTNKSMYLLMDEPLDTISDDSDDTFKCHDVPTDMISDDYDPKGYDQIDVASALLCEPDMSDDATHSRRDSIRTKVVIDKIKQDFSELTHNDSRH